MENIIEGSYVGRRIIVRYAWDGEKGIISSQGIGGVVTKDDDPDAIFYGARLDDGREIEVCVKSDDVDFL